LTVTGTLNVSSGTYHMASALATVATDNITVPSGGVINLSGTGAIDEHDVTVNAGGSVSQTGGTWRSSHYFKNSGTYDATGGTFEFNGSGGGMNFNSPGTNQFFNVLVDTGVTAAFDSTIAASVGVRGGWTNNGTISLTGQATTVTFNGTGTQTISGNSTNFRNLTINKASGGVTLGVDTTVALSGANTGTLTLTSGVITTGSNTLILASGGSVSRTASTTTSSWPRLTRRSSTSISRSERHSRSPIRSGLRFASSRATTSSSDRRRASATPLESR
jgi:hypothetical protein